MQVEDVRCQLAARADSETSLLEENRRLTAQLTREAGEKKRLSMENEQLCWRVAEVGSGRSVF